MVERCKGGCACGAVRFELNDYPLWVLACHCDPCKKRTGSAFSVSVGVDSSSVVEFSGPVKTFTRHGDSGKPVHYEFCTQCGTTLRWHVELIGRQVFAGGTFDRAREIRVFAEMYANDAMPWARLGCELVREGAPDDQFRKAVIQRTRASR